ncbi:Uu.00g045080.m01.CDS01 [Anthostomella pinea]|uniref:Uu.00g045080.m01.CDS01 n=1 Tax=Anthostomella pinea TaxID=933095 RepID=A0AAI8VC14_9PEZI|nr:Uu.00g045080.m01.CDS01 [Anthostomella pinea]
MFPRLRLAAVARPPAKEGHFPETRRELRFPTVTEMAKMHSPRLDIHRRDTAPRSPDCGHRCHDTRAHPRPPDSHRHRRLSHLVEPSSNRLSVTVPEADRRGTARVHKPAVDREKWNVAAPEEFLPER